MGDFGVMVDGNTAALRGYEAKKDADESAWGHHAPAIIHGFLDDLMNNRPVKTGGPLNPNVTLADFFEPGMMTPDECAIAIGGTQAQWQETKERIQKRTCDDIRAYFEDTVNGQSAVWDRINDEEAAQ